MMKKYWQNNLIIVLSALLLFISAGYCGWIAADVQAQSEVSAEATNEDTVLVGGMPIGIYMETDGVMILDTEQIKSVDGQEYEPAANLVKPGDYIIALNNQAVENKKELVKMLQGLHDNEVILTLRRRQESLTIRLHPVEAEPGVYKLGIWVRDNVQGLGTITFLTANQEFGALGHGIHDSETNELMEIAAGMLYKTSIQTIRKGENGMPGSMEGMIVYNTHNAVGTIWKNTETGIYGTVEKAEEIFPGSISLGVATREEVAIGNATIRCFVDGEIREYAIQVIEIAGIETEANKGLIIQVTDPELLAKTGGIIQGMSGSPIIQKGKLIGAVTHVFVQDSTKGYGIFAESMLENINRRSLSN